MKLNLKISKPNKLYFFGNEPAQTHHSRMRLGISHLNAQLFLYIKAVNPDCPHCAGTPESIVHFFLNCPHYTQQRDLMLQRLDALQNTHDIEISNLPPKEKIKIFLQGGSKYDLTINSAIFTEIQNFIEASQRFRVNSSG